MRVREIPVNVYQELHRIMVAAPMPGMEPQSISIEIDGRRVSIAGALRGPGQQRTQRFLRQEWSVGPYRRTVELPVAVDGSRSNAAYDNGVLVVMLPIAERPSPGTLTMAKVGTAKGQLTQHVGLHPRAP